MEDSILEARMRAYVRMELSDAEHKEFETLLLTTPALQRAYLRYCLKGEGAQELDHQSKIRRMVESVREELGPLPEPRLTLWDYIRYSDYSLITRIFASVFLVVALGMLWINSKDPVSTIAKKYLIIYDCSGGKNEVANGVPSTREGGYERFLCTDNTDSLRILSATDPYALYYLAQIYIRKEDWDNAITELNNFLSNASSLNSADSDRARLNLIVMQLIKDNRYTSPSKESVANLLGMTKEGEEVHQKAITLKNELENPLRWFYFR